MGFFDDIGKIGSDIVDTVGDVASDGADVVGDVAEGAADLAGSALDTAEDIGSSVWDRATDSIETFGEGVFGAAGGALRNLLEAGDTWAHGFSELFDGNVGDAIGDWYSGLFKAFVQTPVDAGLMIGAKTVSAVQTATTIEPLGRKLNDDEIKELRKVFGDSIDYSKIEIKEGSGALGIGDNARTIGNTIYIPEGKTLTKELLVHESTHVWQYQQGGTDYMSEALWAQTAGDAYDYKKGIAEGYPWGDLDPEQQAELMEQAYKAKYFDSDPPSWKLADGTDYTSYMNQAVADLRAGRGAT